MRLIQAKSTQPIELAQLTLSEQVQACCAIAREKLEIGDYGAGCAALQPWWTIGEWPKQEGLGAAAAAELLLTAGTLNGWVASTRQIGGGQKGAKRLLSGAIFFFDHLGEKVRFSESRGEMGFCFYRQGV